MWLPIRQGFHSRFLPPMFTALENNSNTFNRSEFMRKMFFFVLAAAVLLIMVPAQNAQAQSHSETPKVEFGVQYTFLRLRDFDTNTSGVGGRATYNVTDNFGIESEVNFFPQRLTNFATLLSTGSQRTQALFGVKYGM